MLRSTRVKEVISRSTSLSVNSLDALEQSLRMEFIITRNDCFVPQALLVAAGEEWLLSRIIESFRLRCS